MSSFFLCFVCCVWTTTYCNAIELSWTPSDPNGPLPSSKAYRQQLQRLCRHLDDGTLPASFPIDTIRVQCNQLKAAQQASGGADSDVAVPVWQKVGVLCLVVVGVLAYFGKLPGAAQQATGQRISAASSAASSWSSGFAFRRQEQQPQQQRQQQDGPLVDREAVARARLRRFGGEQN
eukprot:c6820_g1_i2.p1 GENE.c6820_g1_i2~~c6820_g1_i2.p1  ORF type:complete len:186 (-),score=40.64 c6820_g1_i2:116-646(-)